MFTSALFTLVLAAVAEAIQPEARSAVAAPLRDLPWSQLNILHTTDVHGWFGGHLQEYSFPFRATSRLIDSLPLLP
jgi:2',3'-cyclic-nucleotide 2'-phosphodiesterase (5'-nucleotidase family)